jgi:Fic family protein
MSDKYHMPKKSNYNLDQLLSFIKEHPQCSSSELIAGLKLQISTATLKRILQELIQKESIESIGEYKKRRYQISKSYDILRPIEVEKYFEEEIDDRDIKFSFNLDLMIDTLHHLALFTQDEMTFLNKLQDQFTSNVSRLSKVEYDKEMERLAIDLSWKSSQIEGNTYSLLETEQLLKEKQTASGKTKDEAIMLLNHKDALDFILANPGYINPIAVSVIEDIHSILIKELNISRNIRNTRVGISGTNYKPLDNEFQIKEALLSMCNLINEKMNVFEKALLSLLLISYIQPFSDGNKRTGRIISNAIFIKYNYCPISFRTVDSIAYKKAMLIFYEQNNIQPFKQIFIDQFDFAVRTYF